MSVETRLESFARRRTQGAEILADLAKVVGAAGDQTGAEHLDALSARAREGRFVVLLLGCFSSGKSTLLNALLGRPALPVKVNPCTAILTEVVYGETPSVEVRYHDGQTRQLDVDAFLDEFQLHTASHSEAGTEATDRFGEVDRAVLAYPYPLLNNGVVLLDTPGLDDDGARTARTLSSLPDADAVIVVLNATRFLSELERRTLRRNLLPLGLTNLFFPATMVDLLDALSDTPEDDLADIHARAREHLGPLCIVDGVDRFEHRFFPLDARGGLLARWSGDAPRDPVDEAALQASGLPAFEDALENFLVSERGQAQLNHLVRTARRIRDEIDRKAELDRATADASVEELERRQQELEPQFEALTAIRDRVERTVDAYIGRQKVLVFNDLRDFLIRCEQDLPDAVDGFDLGGLAGLDLLTPKGRIRVEAQIRDELEVWLDDRVARWQRSLRPRIEESLRNLRKEIAADARDFDELMGRIVTDFAGGLEMPNTHVGADVDPVERWFSVAMGAVLLSPGAMAAGWTEGYEGALKGAAGRIGVRLAIVTLGALLGPVGWLGLMGLTLYAVSDAVLLVLSGGSQLKRLRDQVAFNLQGKLVEQADKSREDIAERVAEGLAPLRDGLVGAANAEAAELRDLLDSTITARTRAASEAASRGELWTRTLDALDQGIQQLEALVATE